MSNIPIANEEQIMYIGPIAIPTAGAESGKRLKGAAFFVAFGVRCGASESPP
jgi:hypothetical protein